MSWGFISCGKDKARNLPGDVGDINGDLVGNMEYHGIPWDVLGWEIHGDIIGYGICILYIYIYTHITYIHPTISRFGEETVEETPRNIHFMGDIMGIPTWI